MNWIVDSFHLYRLIFCQLKTHLLKQEIDKKVAYFIYLGSFSQLIRKKLTL